MSELRDQLERARDAYREQQYAGDLADLIQEPRVSPARPWAMPRGARAVAFLFAAAAVVLLALQPWRAADLPAPRPAEPRVVDTQRPTTTLPAPVAEASPLSKPRVKKRPRWSATMAVITPAQRVPFVKSAIPARRASESRSPPSWIGVSGYPQVLRESPKTSVAKRTRALSPSQFKVLRVTASFSDRGRPVSRDLRDGKSLSRRPDTPSSSTLSIRSPRDDA